MIPGRGQGEGEMKEMLYVRHEITLFYRTYLSNIGKPYQIGDNAYNGNEDFSSIAQQLRKFIHQSCYESFHGAELQVKLEIKYNRMHYNSRITFRGGAFSTTHHWPKAASIK